MIVAVGAAYLGKVVYHHSLSEREMSICVPAGQRMQMTLADGSHVQLNAGTTLEYPVVFDRKARRVKLSGEALFEVTHDSSHPFIVETFATDIQVLGTKFNVLADSGSELFFEHHRVGGYTLVWAERLLDSRHRLICGEFCRLARLEIVQGLSAQPELLLYHCRKGDNQQHHKSHQSKGKYERKRLPIAGAL